MGLLLTWNTVRYLRTTQVVNRVKRTLLPWSGQAHRSPGFFRLVRRAPCLPAKAPNVGFDGKSFRFLNRSLPFEGADRWDPGTAGRLWVYNLHYFQYLWGLPAREGFALMKDWVASHTRGTGWEPYPLSLRIREWIEWLEAHPETAEEDFVPSLARQVVALEDQLEYHLLGNHLLENAITLCWAGTSLEGPLSRRWLERGLTILREQIGVQCLQDGSHDERSPMYQALLCEALLRLAEVAGFSALASAREVCERAGGAGRLLLQSLGPLVHPDGGYALVNDSVQGVAAPYERLCSRFSDVHAAPLGPWSLTEAGYRGFRDRTGDYFLLDAGPLGPDHQPGHGHADMLAFELDRTGRRVFTDTGCGTYTEGPSRAYDRSTAAHNTLEVDGRNQSELWGAFRCGRRARIVTVEEEEATVSAEYEDSSRRVRHQRSVRHDGALLTVVDRVESRGEHVARVRLHVAPDIWVRKQPGGWALGEGSSQLAQVVAPGFELGTSLFHPEFGLDLERPCLMATFSFKDVGRFDFAVVRG